MQHSTYEQRATPTRLTCMRETALSKAQAGCRELICEHSMFLSQVSSQTPGYSHSREKQESRTILQGQVPLRGRYSLLLEQEYSEDS